MFNRVWKTAFLAVLSVLIASTGFVLAQGLMQGAGLAGNRADAQINGALDSFFGAGGSTEVTPQQVQAVDINQFRYTYDAAVTPLVHKEILASLALNDAAATQEVQAVLNQFTPELQQEIMDAAFVEGGWKATDMIDVFAATILTSFGILQGIEETTPVQDASVRDLLRVAFDGMSTSELTNADKQLMVETMLIVTVLSALQLEEARANNDAVSLADLQDGAKTLLMSFGIHPSIFKLGESGLEESDKMRTMAPQLEAGTITFEEAFPEITADYQGFGQDTTPIVPIADTATETVLETAVEETVVETGPATGGINAALGLGGNTPATETSPTIPTTPAVAAVTEAPLVNPLAPKPAAINPLVPKPEAVNPLAQLAKPDLLSGNYSNDDLSLTLNGDGESYTGELVLGEQLFPVTATVVDAVSGIGLEGQFMNGADSFDFTAVLEEDVLEFASGGNSFSLVKQKPVNPLSN